MEPQLTKNTSTTNILHNAQTIIGSPRNLRLITEKWEDQLPSPHLYLKEGREIKSEFT